MRTVRLVAALAVALVLPACVRMPTEGPVVVRDATAQAEEQPGIYFDPKPPQPGQSASEVVTGFLEAMKAVPIRTSVAAQFLSSRAQAEWSPETSTVTYAEASAAQGELEVRVDLTGVNRYDSSGAWRERQRRHRLTFGLVSEAGEWRIDELPDALVVPESWFQDWYRRVSLYYFDPTAQILVPEPVFVPDEEQVATSLVGALLGERPPRDAAATRTFVPEELAAPRAVTVTPEGVAEVALESEDEGSDEVPVLDDLTTQRVLTQLAWTLRQEPAIRSFRVSIGGQQLQLPGGNSEFGVMQGSGYDPAGSEASPLVYGLRDGLLVSGSPDALEAVDGPLGSTAFGVRSIGVNLDATRVAGVTGEGTSVVVGPVEGRPDQLTEVVSGATNLLRPAWDFSARLWLADRGPQGARFSFVEGGRPAVPLNVPGVTGEEIRSFLV
ncbi:MAG TPA: LpqB family beta-propeller domain-containing protein, partial [Nocardioides sp.]